MGFEYVSKLPTPDEIRAQFPLAPALAEEKARKDEEIKDVFTGKSSKFLVIIGPCSADREDSVCEYVSRLAKVQDKVKDKLILIPRIYTNKPRTTGDGYKGLLHQPNPEKKPNLYEGLIAIRKLHMRVIEETGFSTADEMLYPENLTYLSDVMSYIAVGARSVENQQHRLVSSGIDVPVGMKNPTSGALSVMLNAVHAAQHGHEFITEAGRLRQRATPLPTAFSAVQSISTTSACPIITMKICACFWSSTQSAAWKILPALWMPTTPIPTSSIWSRSGL